MSMLAGKRVFDQGRRPSLAAVVDAFNDRISQENLMLAHEGDREAMILVGQMMVSQGGFGLIARDMERGKQWLKKAARKGSLQAIEMMNRIAQMEQMELIRQGPPIQTRQQPPPRTSPSLLQQLQQQREQPPHQSSSTIWSQGCKTRSFGRPESPDAPGNRGR